MDQAGKIHHPSATSVLIDEPVDHRRVLRAVLRAHASEKPKDERADDEEAGDDTASFYSKQQEPISVNL